MGRILISEDEKKRILGMHVDKGYTSIVNEQGVKPTPPAPVKKTVTVADANNSYLQFDPVGQILAKNPAFVKFINDNKINLKAAKLQLAANNSQATMVTAGSVTWANRLRPDWLSITIVCWVKKTSKNKMPKLSSAELAKREDVIQKMKKNKRSLVKRYGPDAEKVMYGRATNIANNTVSGTVTSVSITPGTGMQVVCIGMITMILLVLILRGQHLFIYL